jgi:hypothetical protein
MGKNEEQLLGRIIALEELCKYQERRLNQAEEANKFYRNSIFGLLISALLLFVALYFKVQ